VIEKITPLPREMEMLPDDVSIKLHAAAYDEDPEFADIEDDLDQIDEEEEEVFSDDSHGDEIRVEEHSEQADLFAPPSTPAQPYQPPTRLSEEPVPAPPAPMPPAPKKAPAKKVVKKAAKKTTVKKAVKKAAKKVPAKKAKKKSAGKKLSSVAKKGAQRGGKAAVKRQQATRAQAVKNQL